MATRTQSRTSNRCQLEQPQQQREAATASSFAEAQRLFLGRRRGPIIAAALGGAAIGLAANYGRKFLMQGMEAAIGDWDEILAAEHDMALGDLRQDAGDR